MPWINMQPALALLVGLIVLLLILIVAAYGWYNFVGWQSFSFKTGDNPSWTPTSGNVQDLRFKNVKYTLSATAAQTTPVSWDVSAVLNSMAVAYKAPKNAPAAGAPPALTLRAIGPDGHPHQIPLGPFSFIKDGVNDAKNSGSPNGTVPDPTAAPWPSVTVVLSGKFRTV